MKHTLESLLTLAETDEGKQQIRVMVAEVAGWKPSDDWWCPKCQMPVIARDVTNDERHDVRHGGCGAFVETEEPMLTYHTSLDAITPEVRKLDEQARNRWINHMADIIDPMGELEWRADFAIATADPIHYCIALLATPQA